MNKEQIKNRFRREVLELVETEHFIFYLSNGYTEKQAISYAYGVACVRVANVWDMNARTIAPRLTLPEFRVLILCLCRQIAPNVFGFYGLRQYWRKLELINSPLPIEIAVLHQGTGNQLARRKGDTISKAKRVFTAAKRPSVDKRGAFYVWSSSQLVTAFNVWKTKV